MIYNYQVMAMPKSKATVELWKTLLSNRLPCRIINHERQHHGVAVILSSRTQVLGQGVHCHSGGMLSFPFISNLQKKVDYCNCFQLKRNISLNATIWNKTERKDDLVEAPKKNYGEVTVGQKVAQAGKDVSYMTILLIGFGVTATLIWYVASELLFSFSPNSVYSKAFKMVKKNQEILEAIGTSIKGYGEETSRGRRRHVSFQEYTVDGVNYMRIKFYVAGSQKKGTVHAEAREITRGRMEFRYIFVELQGNRPETIVILDNR